MRVLITGGAGFIGSHLAAGWLQRGADVVVIDNFRTGKRENLSGLDVELVESCITDTAAVRHALRGVEIVHHLAALVSVPESVERPLEAERLNVMATIQLLEEARQAGVKRFVFSSSSAVYGNVVRPAHSEDNLPAPASPYAITKLAGEYYVTLAGNAGPMTTVSLRYFNVYGPRQDPSSPYAAAIPIFLEKSLQGKALTIFGDGGQTRDFVFVDDVVAANLLAAERGEGVFNVATGRSISILELATLIRNLTGTDAPINFAAERLGDVRHSCGNSDRLARLGWQPQVSLEEGLKKTLEWAKSRWEAKKDA